MEKYGGHFSRLLDLATGSAVALLGSVLAEFPCFRDGAEFEGRPVTFHKRAQILVMDLWCLFAGMVQRTGFQTNVADPDPYVFLVPGSGSGSISERYGSGYGSESFFSQAKIVRKSNLYSYCFVTFFLLFIFEK